MKRFLNRIRLKRRGKRKHVTNSRICLFFLVFIVSLISQTGQAVEKLDTSVILHKIVYQESDLPVGGIANEGKEVSSEFLLGGRPLSGAEFSVFDVTTHFYDLTEGEKGLKVVEAQTKISDEGKTAKENNQLNEKFGEPVAMGTTNNEGIINFNLEKSLIKGMNRTYLIMETKVPEIIQEAAQNIILTLPLKDANGDESAQPIHLYPKNVEQVRDPYFYKHGKDGSGKDTGALEGASFRLYKVINNEKYFLHETPYSNGNTWVKEDEAGIAEFCSDQNGKVTINDHHLPVGTYFFEETKAPSGYKITEAAKKIQVNVPASANESVTITLNDQNVLMEQAIVYNDLQTDLPKTSGKPRESLVTAAPVTSEVHKKSLPSTGEVVSKMLPIIGLGIIIGCVILYKR